MNSVNTTVATIFKRILANGDSKKLIDEVNQRLLQTLKNSPSEDEYVNKLIGEIAFLTESTKALHGILQQVITMNKYPNLEGIEKLMNKAKETIRGDMGRLMPLYEKELKAEEVEEDKITQLEVFYTTTMVELQLTFDFLTAFGTKSNEERFKPLFDHTPEEVGEHVFKYARTYSSLLFEKKLSEMK
jgi:uncharacterized membrane-anchored protein YjiN (DUF445 family)